MTFAADNSGVLSNNYLTRLNEANRNKDNKGELVNLDSQLEASSEDVQEAFNRVAEQVIKGETFYFQYPELLNKDVSLLKNYFQGFEAVETIKNNAPLVSAEEGVKRAVSALEACLANIDQFQIDQLQSIAVAPTLTLSAIHYFVAAVVGILTIASGSGLLVGAGASAAVYLRSMLMTDDKSQNYSMQEIGKVREKLSGIQNATTKYLESAKRVESEGVHNRNQAYTALENSIKGLFPEAA